MIIDREIIKRVNKELFEEGYKFEHDLFFLIEKLEKNNSEKINFDYLYDEKVYSLELKKIKSVTLEEY